MTTNQIRTVVAIFPPNTPLRTAYIGPNLWVEYQSVQSFLEATAEVAQEDELKVDHTGAADPVVAIHVDGSGWIGLYLARPISE